ncbi:hypothetical protein C8J56DRAFT_884411 [Mycena floridula]|nr:hypothetical protein C8J56DRAFT_884411 [Mycena floridula]
MHEAKNKPKRSWSQKKNLSKDKPSRFELRTLERGRQAGDHGTVPRAGFELSGVDKGIQWSDIISCLILNAHLNEPTPIVDTSRPTKLLRDLEVKGKTEIEAEKAQAIRNLYYLTPKLKMKSNCRVEELVLPPSSAHLASPRIPLVSAPTKPRANANSMHCLFVTHVSVLSVSHAPPTVDGPCNLVDFLHRADRVGRAGVVFGVDCKFMVQVTVEDKVTDMRAETTGAAMIMADTVVEIIIPEKRNHEGPMRRRSPLREREVRERVGGLRLR